jgi:hypothetical protein
VYSCLRTSTSSIEAAQLTATTNRSWGSCIISWMKPWPSSVPRRFDVGTRTSSKNSSRVSLPFMPILSSTRPRRKPARSVSTVSSETPDAASVGSVFAATSTRSAMAPLVTLLDEDRLMRERWPPPPYSSGIEAHSSRASRRRSSREAGRGQRSDVPAWAAEAGDGGETQDPRAAIRPGEPSAPIVTSPVTTTSGPNVQSPCTTNLVASFRLGAPDGKRCSNGPTSL